jgi:hypothetical protein
MKKTRGILEAIAFLLSVPFGVAGFALQYAVCPQTKETKARQKRTEKLKENEKERWGTVLGAGKT